MEASTQKQVDATPASESSADLSQVSLRPPSGGGLSEKILNMARASTVALAGVGVSAATGEAEGGLMLSMGNNQAHLDWGAQMNAQGHLISGTVWVPGVGVGYRDISATPYVVQHGGQLHSYAFISKHSYTDLSQYNPTFDFSNGPGQQGELRGEVLGIEWITPHATLDFAIVKLAGNFSNAVPTTIGTFISGAIGTVAGYGYSAVVGGAQWNDKLSRAGNTYMTFSGSDPYTIITEFGTGIPLDYKKLQGGSNSPIYNNHNELVGMILTEVGGVGPWGLNGALNLSHPEVLSFIHDVTAIPAPGAALPLVAGGLLMSRRRRRDS